MSLSPAFLDELRARTSLSGLVGRTVRLTKKGGEFQACCPFHQEKTPSFYVNDAKGFYHCFGCSAHGDAIRWMTDHGGLDFIDAVKELAAAAGMEMPARDPRAQQQQDERAPLYAAMDAAARFYAGHRDARAPGRFLDDRGIGPDLAERFGLGFAPDGGSALIASLRQIENSVLALAGLVKVVDGRAPYDRFRARVMFPIHDARGRVIAFGGRVIGQGDPKYLNSPDTPLFDKGRTLFNLHRAAPAARRTDRLIVVEGYMDVIGLARVGIDDVVAPNGTALTEAQLSLAWKLSAAPVMCFDGDGAGGRAMTKAALRALPAVGPGRSLRFVQLPQGQDPDEVTAAGGAAAFDHLLAGSIGLAELLWRTESAVGRLEEPEGRAALRQRLLDHVATIEDGPTREQYRQEFHRRFDEAFARQAPAGTPRPPRAAWRGGRWSPPEPPVSDMTKAIRRDRLADQVRLAILAGLLRFPDVAGEQVEALVGIRLEGRYGELLDLIVDKAIAGELSDDIGQLLEQHGMGGAPAALREVVRLPFAFLGGGDDARGALVDAIYAEANR